jgi:DNA-directed RNA polymerase subunit RPC12/RpoP
VVLQYKNGGSMSMKGIKGVLYISCGGCKTQIDLTKATHNAESKRKRDIKCPSCGYRIGQIN